MNTRAGYNRSNFDSLMQRAVDHELSHKPTHAYYAGLKAPDHRRWHDRSPTAIRAYQHGNDKLLKELRNIDPCSLSDQSMGYHILKEHLESEAQMRICRSELWDVSHVFGWHLFLSLVAESQPVETADQCSQALERWTSTPAMVDQEINNLQRGLREGYSAPKAVVGRVIKQISRLANTPAQDSPLASPAKRSVDRRFSASFEAVVVERVNPALRKFADYLQTQYLPKARDALAISAHPEGAQCYQAFLRSYTTTSRSAQEIYELGSRTVSANAEVAADIGAGLFGTRDLSTIIDHMERASDNRFASKDELISFSRRVVARAQERSAPYFYHLPSQIVLVEPFRDFMRGSGAGSHYELQTDISKPAYYRIAADDWAGTRKSDAELLAVHETFPGHHLQISLSHELEQSPVVKLSFNSAYLEGWARYAEMLAEEIGVYTNNYVRIVRRIWPARGMVADPGLHVFGWTREQTLSYLMETGKFTQITANDLVDRMAATPGQLTSYDCGGIEVMQLRNLAKRALGGHFDLREFHRVILERGVVPLEALRKNVEEWVARHKAGAAPRS